ncbi:MAG: peptide-methionine (S)-S-oxide reductase MsrA, partial [Thermoproteota archaeon]|nr:peptide-methionine (S)-S-oxide reductase MsrA [Thermoproteota archaeon]
MQNEKYEVAVLGGGCFWCTEAIFKRIKGVINVEPGYAGGWKENPTYEEVCTGETGHAEVVRIIFNPTVISYRELLKIFFRMHDPTTPNR